MAKTIKFNLICDNNPVRTIDDLQENFSIEDVLKYYENGLLIRWLKVRGYNEEAKQVEEINSSDYLSVIKELIQIFRVKADNEKIEESVYILQYLEERKELCEIYAKENFKISSIIDDYQSGYMQLVDGILESPNDMAKIKANIAEMVTNYRWALDLNHRELFWKLKDRSILAIMCLLMNKETRNYYLPVQFKSEELPVLNMERNRNRADTASKRAQPPKQSSTSDIDSNPDKRNMFHEIGRITKSSEFIEKLGDNLYVFAGETDGYWKDIETKGKNYMIISIGAGDFVRGAGVQGGDLASSDVVDKFVIVDGIDYKSKSSSRKLMYMEV